jgi:hypothetical protein
MADFAPAIGSKYTNARGSMAFPWDLEKQPYWMSFAFVAYSKTVTKGRAIDQNLYFEDTGMIRLPLPNSMVDDQQINYSAEPLNTAVLMNKTAADAASAATGTITNPLLTVLFKSPAFKKLQFEWKLAPSNESESRTINSIINTIKYNMLPSISGGGIALSYPNVVQLTVSSASGDNFSYYFKPAVIETFSVNYTPSGTPSFFGTTKAPTEVQIRLGLMEIEYWVSGDYGESREGFVDKGIKSFMDLLPTVGPIKIESAGGGPVNNDIPAYNPV